MEAWHGTHNLYPSFNHDFFGTGENASEAGWGLYFAAFRPGGEWYGEYLKMRKGTGFLYQVTLNFAETEIVSIDTDQKKQNQLAYSNALKALSPFSKSTHLRTAYNETIREIGKKEAAAKLLKEKIKVVHSSHSKKPHHGETYVALSSGIISIKKKYQLLDTWVEIK